MGIPLEKHMLVSCHNVACCNGPALQYTILQDYTVQDDATCGQLLLDSNFRHAGGNEHERIPQSHEILASTRQAECSQCAMPQVNKTRNTKLLKSFTTTGALRQAQIKVASEQGRRTQLGC